MAYLLLKEAKFKLNVAMYSEHRANIIIGVTMGDGFIACLEVNTWKTCGCFLNQHSGWCQVQTLSNNNILYVEALSF